MCDEINGEQHLSVFLRSASIDDVKSDSKFVWHTQRYKLVREYYEKPILAHPPLSLLVYIVLLIKMCRGRRPVFRTLSKQDDEVSKKG